MAFNQKEYINAYKRERYATISIRIDKHKAAAFRERCAERNDKIKDVIEKAIDRYLSRTNKEKIKAMKKEILEKNIKEITEYISSKGKIIPRIDKGRDEEHPFLFGVYGPEGWGLICPCDSIEEAINEITKCKEDDDVNGYEYKQFDYLARCSVLTADGDEREVVFDGEGYIDLI